MNAKPGTRLKVVYIAGWGRSGSTILGNIMGQAPGFQFVGEVQSIWQRGFLDNQQCGCGRRFRSCDIWTSVTTQLFMDNDTGSPADIAKLAYQQTRTVRLVGLIISVLTGKFPTRLITYLEILDKLYRAIHRITHGKVIVDSSKSPIYGSVLALIPGLEVYFVHLVRDARAVAYSYCTKRRGKDASQARHLSVHPPVFTAVMWSIWNMISELLGKLRIVNYCRIRYEDFATSPQNTLDQLMSFIGEPQGLIPVLPGGVVHVEPEHSISGNPSRFQLGDVQVRLDTRWKRYLAPQSRLLVNVLAWPILLRYHYL